MNHKIKFKSRHYNHKLLDDNDARITGAGISGAQGS
jgi:hypothetical protein